VRYGLASFPTGAAAEDRTARRHRYGSNCDLLGYRPQRLPDPGGTAFGPVGINIIIIGAVVAYIDAVLSGHREIRKGRSPQGSRFFSVWSRSRVTGAL